MYNLRLRPTQRSYALLSGTIVSGYGVATDIVAGAGAGAVGNTGVALAENWIYGAGTSDVRPVGIGEYRFSDAFMSGTGIVGPVGTADANVTFTKSATGTVRPIGIGAAAVALLGDALGFGGIVTGVGAFNVPFVIVATGGQIQIPSGVGAGLARLSASGSGTVRPAGVGSASARIVASGQGVRGNKGAGAGVVGLTGGGQAARGVVSSGSASVQMSGYGAAGVGAAGVGECAIGITVVGYGTVRPMFFGVGAVTIDIHGDGRGEFPIEHDEYPSSFLRMAQNQSFVVTE